jgi:protocatechuate 3,4-dioxygenase beta subunit
MDRKIDRRAALGTLGLGALLAACGGSESRPETRERFGADSNCTLTPEMTEGPFYIDADAVRSDIRAGRDGTPLKLAIRVRDSSCEPVRDALVDIWHCDAAGGYSTAEDPFLRGTQVTNADGIVEFTTIYPGWYRGRTVHIHAKVHLDSSTVLTTQLFFDDDVSAAVFEREPYASNPGRDQFNDTDGLFDEALVLDLTEDGDAYVGTISFDVAAT